MSTWTSDRVLRVMAIGAVCALAGCAVVGDGALAGFGAGDADGEPLRRAALFDGEVVVVPPQGYCIDRSSLRRKRGGHVLLLAACGPLTGQPAMTVDPAVMTVSVLPYDARASQPAANEFAATLRPAPIRERIDGDGVSIVHVGAGGQAGIPGGDPNHWRGAMLINGHLTGLALYAPQGSRVARGEAGQALIIDLAENLRQASPKRVVRPAASGVQTAVSGDEADG